LPLGKLGKGLSLLAPSILETLTLTASRLGVLSTLTLTEFEESLQQDGWQLLDTDLSSASPANNFGKTGVDGTITTYTSSQDLPSAQVADSTGMLCKIRLCSGGQ
jgi:hypothetical protein